MKQIYKFYTYTKREGVAKTAKRTLRYLGKRFIKVKREIDVLVASQDVIHADYINHPYVKPPLKSASTLKIGWVLSPLSAGSGGQNTIVRFAKSLVAAGHDVTFYIYEGPQVQSLSEAKEILEKNFKCSIRVRKLAQYEESDALIATGWETMYPTFSVSTNAHKFYFVQDFEPYFYGVGSKYVLAENTYKMNFYGITAGPWLTKKVNEYGMEADYFDFGADLDIYRQKDMPVKKKKICFYARPVTERRAFEIGVMSLELFHAKHPEYEIEFFGWDTSDYRLPFPYKNSGILHHDELASLYHESVACLVLSLTNVSLLPLELLAAGCVPIMNDGENNRMVLHDMDQYVDYAPNNPVQIANALSAAVERDYINEYAETVSSSVHSISWTSSYEKVEKIIKRQVTGA